MVTFSAKIHTWLIDAHLKERVADVVAFALDSGRLVGEFLRGDADALGVEADALQECSHPFRRFVVRALIYLR